MACGKVSCRTDSAGLGRVPCGGFFSDMRRRVSTGSGNGVVLGLRNFHGVYKLLVDAWVLYDNSGPSRVLIDGKKIE